MQNIPTITRYLLIINVLAFIVFNIFHISPEIAFYLKLHFWGDPYFHIYQFITYMFMHAGWTHIFFNMFALWMFGCLMERTFGAKRFLIYYLVCGIGAGITQEVVQTLTLSFSITEGASGAVYGILLAFGMMYPDEKMFVFPIPVPIKAKWFVVGYAILELALAYFETNDGVAHMAHLGGMLFGFFLIRYWRKTAKRQTSFAGWDSYKGSNSSSDSASILGRIRKWMHIDHEYKETPNKTKFTSTSTHQSDWDYNAERKKEEAEIDAILDKIRCSGYASLSAEEKRKLFEASKK